MSYVLSRGPRIPASSVHSPILCIITKESQSITPSNFEGNEHIEFHRKLKLHVQAHVHRHATPNTTTSPSVASNALIFSANLLCASSLKRWNTAPVYKRLTFPFTSSRASSDESRRFATRNSIPVFGPLNNS